MQGRKVKLNKRVQQLRADIALQERGRRVFTQLCEEKLSANRELLPRLREAVKQDVCALHALQKPKRALSYLPHRELPSLEPGRAEKLPVIALSAKTVEEAQEKHRAKLYRRVNTANMLLYQVRQRRQARDELQRRLQQLQHEEELEEKWQQKQVQVIRQLKNNIEKMAMKIQASENVAALYLKLQDVLRKELAQLPQHLEHLEEMTKLYDGELTDLELMAWNTRKAAAATKEDMAKRKSQILSERELQHHSLAEQKVHVASLKEGTRRLVKAQSKAKLRGRTLSLRSQDSLMGTIVEDTEMEYKARVNMEIEKAKTLLHCSRAWDIPSSLLEQQQSSVGREQLIQQCQEKKRALQERLNQLELKQAELKFGQPVDTSRELEEELRLALQREEARLEQKRAQMQQNQELFFLIESGTNKLFADLHGITVPGQDDSIKAESLEEKLQCCRQKLQHLVQRAASLPPHSLDEDNQALVKLMCLVEETTANDPRNLKISLQDVGGSTQ
ncbi:PREDICTED: coiled-coil domain-containing protein 183, partial [Buceros rhinoceros silvestris]|uniref:coiled-coil domain-containing protein 183 n=1 Tax=Buceros rhinoceros silvestris TaxID=175836 RepID=UPI0005293669